VVFGLAFVVDGQPAALAQPGEGAFHDPPAGQDLEVVDAGAFAEDRQGEVRTGRPRDQLAGVAGIGPHQPDRGEVAAQAPQQPAATVAVLDAGGVTRMSSGSPQVSVARCGLWPWTFLAAS
jgi:hypothetical protein